MRFEPREHQRRAIKFLVGQPHAALFLDPGLGKTSAVLAAFKLLRAKRYTKTLLVIAPLRVCQLVWPAELAKWDDFAFLSHRVLHGKTRTLDGPAVDVYLINPEGLPWLMVELAKRGGAWPFDWLVLDESTRFKNTRTQRFKLLKNHLPRFGRRTLLTGTPTPNGLLDLFGQVYCLDLGKALGRFITHYRAEFFEQTGFRGYEWRLRPGADAMIHARLAPLALSMTADDWLALPSRIDNVVQVELPPDARRTYDQLERDLVTQLDAGTLLAANAAAVTIKCRQLANGGVYLEGGSSACVHDAKLDALEELVDELQGSPLLVAYEFKHDLERLRARFGKKTPALRGGLSGAEAKKIVDAWNRGELPLLLAQPQSAALGLNLQGSGHNVAWFGLVWDFEVYDQFVKRVWRSGQASDRVVVHHLVARDTVDEAVLVALTRKHRGQRDLLDALKSRLSTRSGR